MKVSIDKCIDTQGQPYQLYIEAVDTAGDLRYLQSMIAFDACETPADLGAYLMAFGEKLARRWLEHEESAKQARAEQIATGEAGTA